MADRSVREKAIAEYRTAVLHMLRCVTIVSTAEFGDAVNEVIKARRKLASLNIELNECEITTQQGVLGE